MQKCCTIVVVISLFLGACEKAKSITDTKPTNPNAPANYQPDSAGSTWNYQVTENFNPSSSILLEALASAEGLTLPAIDTSYTYTVTATGRDSVVGTSSYSIFTTDSSSADDMLISNQDSVYYGIGVIPTFSLGNGLVGGAISGAVLYLKNEPARTTWTQSIAQTINGASDTSVFTFTVVSTGGTKVINGVNYTGVITETVSFVPGGLASMLSSLGGSLPISPSSLAISGTYYFAQGVGLIEVDVNNSLFGFSYTQVLMSSTIK
jgi:hypothetical protein